MESTSTKSTRNTTVLVKWMDEHLSNPYPTKLEKSMLAEKAGMSARQLNDWFNNTRRKNRKLGKSGE